LHILSVCSLAYSARSAHAPFCQLWPVRFYSIFPHLINHTIFEEKKNVIGRKLSVFIISLVFPETFFILRGIERDMIKM
jgi:hypothetical protein